MEYIVNVTVNEAFVTTDSRKAAMIRAALNDYRKKLHEVDVPEELKQIADELVEVTKMENATVKTIDIKEVIT